MSSILHWPVASEGSPFGQFVIGPKYEIGPNWVPQPVEAFNVMERLLPGASELVDEEDGTAVLKVNVECLFRIGQNPGESSSNALAAVIACLNDALDQIDREFSE